MLSLIPTKIGAPSHLNKFTVDWKMKLRPEGAQNMSLADFKVVNVNQVAQFTLSMQQLMSLWNVGD